MEEITTEAKLAGAISRKKKIDIAYQGGIQPGAVRQITPISIKGGKVRAFCHTSEALKTFTMEKIVIVDSAQSGLVSWQPGLQPSQRYVSIGQFLEENREALTRLGWHIESGADYLTLHRIGKRGKPLKSCEVSLIFDEYTHDLVVDENLEVHEENIRKKQRPWMVRAIDRDSKSFGSIDSATTVFMEWAKALAVRS